MILSASRRTDIPCCYPEWFLKRLQAGEVLVRNPYRPLQVSRLRLSPETVDCIVFWTKEPQPMLPYLDELDKMGYRYCFQFTITPYDRTIEHGLREKSEIIKTFHTISARNGKETVFWRYDPIILNDTLTIEYHKQAFYRLCEQLSEDADAVTVSFVDDYRGLDQTIVRPISDEQMRELGCWIGKTAKAFGLAARTCCETIDLTSYGVERGSCIDPKQLEQVCGFPLLLKRDRAQRQGCGCMESVDIGAYRTCRNGCVYCYAGGNRRSVLEQDSDNSLLGENLSGKEQITERVLRSDRVGQLTLY